MGCGSRRFRKKFRVSFNYIDKFKASTGYMRDCFKNQSTNRMKSKSVKYMMKDPLNKFSMLSLLLPWKTVC